MDELIKFVVVGLIVFGSVIFQALKKSGALEKQLDDPGLEKRLEEAIRQAKRQTSARRSSAEPPVTSIRIESKSNPSPSESIMQALPPMPAKLRNIIEKGLSQLPKKEGFEFKTPDIGRGAKKSDPRVAATSAGRNSALRSGLRTSPSLEFPVEPEESHAMPEPESRKQLAAQKSAPEGKPAAAKSVRRSKWRRAVVMREVLMPPLALRRAGGGGIFDRR